MCLVLVWPFLIFASLDFFELFACSALVVGCLRRWALLVLFAFAALIVCLPVALAFPCFVSGLLASPLCGAGTYFSLPPQREVGKRKRLKPP
ncbi:hypothetical protein PQQ96_22310, partial [Paraburkholderia sediminicola]|uniref:hypothetical protein n=1 Tax=Paraburkholderia sediminicola TaxID=458836 RepID=UPI0038BE1A19